MSSEGDEGSRDPLERVLAVRNQRRAQAAAEEAAAAARSKSAAEMLAARKAQRAPRAVVDAESPDHRPRSRFEVPASVIVEWGDAIVLCRLMEVSLTGAQLSTGGVMLDGLELGSQLTITMVANHDAKLQVDVVGRVVRSLGDIFALNWSDDEETRAELARFLDALSTPSLPSEAESRRAELAAIDDRLEGREAGEHPTQASSPRAKARLVVSASLLIDHGGRSEELVLLNVSRTGGLAASAGAVLSTLRVGTLVLLTLARSDDPAVTVELLARVVRHEGHATAVDWSEDQAAEYALARFLDQLVQEDDER